MSAKPMTTEEFREHIRRLCGISEVEAKRSNKCLIRKPSDRGYYPPTKTKGKAKR